MNVTSLLIALFGKNYSNILQQLLIATWQTIEMIAVAGFIAALCGIPLGVLLIITRKGGIAENKTLQRISAVVVDVVRSIPFIILLVALVPLTRLLVGTSIGTAAAMVPLSIGAIPFVARIVESAISEVPAGLTETGHALGASPIQIIFRILLPESMTAIIRGITLTLITLVGYSAMAGTIGGGGLGDLAIRFGYQRFEIRVMLWTVVILIVMVHLLQAGGDFLVKRYEKT